MLFELGSISLSQNESINLLKLCSCPVTNKDEVGIAYQAISNLPQQNWSKSLVQNRQFCMPRSLFRSNLLPYYLWHQREHNARFVSPVLFAKHTLTGTSPHGRSRNIFIMSSQAIDGRTSDVTVPHWQLWHQDWQWKVGPTSNLTHIIIHIWHMTSFLQGFLCPLKLELTTNRQTCVWMRLDAFGCVWMRLDASMDWLSRGKTYRKPWF